MNEYKIRELASYMEAYYSQEADPDYTADGLEKALLWAAEPGETVAGWSLEDVRDRARDEFDLYLTRAQAETILADVAEQTPNWEVVDYCIQKWKDGRQ